MKNVGASVAIAFSAGIVTTATSEAATVRKVQFAGLDRIEIALDHPVSNKNVRTEFLRDIIQITVDGATVYPARIIPAAQSERISKVFAYQYSPKQVRIRISTRGPSQAYRSAFSVQQMGRTIFASLKSPKTAKIPMNSGENAKTVATVVTDTVSSTASRATAPTQVSDPELLKRIEAKGEGTKGTEKTGSEATRSKSAVASSPLPSFGKVAVGLLIAVAGIVGLLLGLRRLQRVAERSQKKMQGFFARMGLAKKAPMIEVVSTQALGPKKSISVVKVQGRMLVLGIAQDSISLITDLGDAEREGLAEGGAGEAFQQILEGKVEKDEKEDARARIRSRLQGLVSL